ncbi:DUF881 domain-containing protein [Ruania alkalisoli]|uniref:DUF881 domain-containing protein n=1 Tax=Ruania alkalisoli TaxID=2779775 RepID=A0A7M1SY08_9MICO|nr:DUF881 domain-containing protein [Ruania alkalisoli]QOR72425.1 DUF881 domain-containing protein [Ruania alkalisoli]
MTLLNEVLERPLDLGYAAASEARRQGTARPATPVRRGLTFLLALVLGLTAVWAARELRTPAGVETASDVLVAQIRERSATGEELMAQNTALRGEIAELQEQALGTEAEELLELTERIGSAVGTTAVEGPGMVVTLSDSASANSGEPDAEYGRVRDVDLQLVVNGLWASGAEAIAVNGHRLTAQTAIRTAGDAILVDLQPMISPYRIEAIGDPDGMRTQFARTQAAGFLNFLAAQASISSSVERADELRLAAGTSLAPSLVTESS